MSVTGQRIAGARQRVAIRNFYFFILVLTDARADYVLARKDAIAFGNLPCTARRAVARIARYRAGLRERVSTKQSVLLFNSMHYI